MTRPDFLGGNVAMHSEVDLQLKGDPDSDLDEKNLISIDVSNAL